MAEPGLFSDNVTKYFTPLLAPGVSLNSNERSNALYSSMVTISPPLADSFPSDEITLITPSPMTHPLSGKVFLYAPFQPLELCPSNSSFQPLLFS
jgi:hypothetical protein